MVVSGDLGLIGRIGRRGIERIYVLLVLVKVVFRQAEAVGFVANDIQREISVG